MDERIMDLYELSEVIREVYIDINGGKYDQGDDFMHHWTRMHETVMWMYYTERARAEMIAKFTDAPNTLSTVQ